MKPSGSFSESTIEDDDDDDNSLEIGLGEGYPLGTVSIQIAQKQDLKFVFYVCTSSVKISHGLTKKVGEEWLVVNILVCYRGMAFSIQSEFLKVQ